MAVVYLLITGKDYRSPLRPFSLEREMERISQSNKDGSNMQGFLTIFENIEILYAWSYYGPKKRRY